MAEKTPEAGTKLHKEVSEALDYLSMLEGATGANDNRGALCRAIRDTLLGMYWDVAHLKGQCHGIEYLGMLGAEMRGVVPRRKE